MRRERNKINDARQWEHSGVEKENTSRRQKKSMAAPFSTRAFLSPQGRGAFPPPHCGNCPLESESSEAFLPPCVGEDARESERNASFARGAFELEKRESSAPSGRESRREVSEKDLNRESDFFFLHFLLFRERPSKEKKLSLSKSPDERENKPGHDELSCSAGATRREIRHLSRKEMEEKEGEGGERRARERCLRSNACLELNPALFSFCYPLFSSLLPCCFLLLLLRQSSCLSL